MAAYTPQLFGDAKSYMVDNSEETDEDFDWFEIDVHTEDTYFNLVNKDRRTVEAGEQIFYCYGNRTNKFLLLNYGFCFPGNKYDSFEVPLALNWKNFIEFSPELIDLEWIETHK